MTVSGARLALLKWKSALVQWPEAFGFDRAPRVLAVDRVPHKHGGKGQPDCPMDQTAGGAQCLIAEVIEQVPAVSLEQPLRLCGLSQRDLGHGIGQNAAGGDDAAPVIAQHRPPAARIDQSFGGDRLIDGMAFGDAAQVDDNSPRDPDPVRRDNCNVRAAPGEDRQMIGPGARQKAGADQRYSV